MSKPNDNPTPITVANPDAVPNEENVVKQSLVAKTKAAIKKHKKPLIAVGLLSGLVGASALAGRATAPTPDFTEAATVDPDDAMDELLVIEQTQNTV